MRRANQKQPDSKHRVVDHWREIQGGRVVGIVHKEVGSYVGYATAFFIFQDKQKGEDMDIKANQTHDREKLIAKGYKPTGITAMDGRFEIIRQPKGVYGATVTWNIWDYAAGDFTSIYAARTLRSAKNSLDADSKMQLSLEVECDVRNAQGDHWATFPDGTGSWISGSQCREAGWRRLSGNWYLPNGKEASCMDYPVVERPRPASLQAARLAQMKRATEVSE